MPTGFFASILLAPKRHGYETAEMLYKWVKDGVEPPLDEVAPRRRRRGEVQMPADTLGIGEPVGDRWRRDRTWRDDLGAQLETKKAELGTPTFAEEAA